MRMYSRNDRRARTIHAMMESDLPLGIMLLASGNEVGIDVRRGDEDLADFGPEIFDRKSANPDSDAAC